MECKYLEMPGGISCIELEHYSQNSWYPVKFTPGVKASFFVLDTFLGSSHQRQCHVFILMSTSVSMSSLHVEVDICTILPGRFGKH